MKKTILILAVAGLLAGCSEPEELYNCTGVTKAELMKTYQVCLQLTSYECERKSRKLLCKPIPKRQD